jgi:hypothetical protein
MRKCSLHAGQGHVLGLIQRMKHFRATSTARIKVDNVCELDSSINVLCNRVTLRLFFFSVELSVLTGTASFIDKVESEQSRHESLLPYCPAALAVKLLVHVRFTNILTDVSTEYKQQSSIRKSGGVTDNASDAVLETSATFDGVMNNKKAKDRQQCMHSKVKK